MTVQVDYDVEVAYGVDYQEHQYHLAVEQVQVVLQGQGHRLEQLKEALEGVILDVAS